MKSKLSNINSNNGRFIDGNPNAGTLGTIVTAEWLNGVQDRMQDAYEELRNVLLLANMQPDGQKQNQVAEAIKAYCNNINLKVQSNTRNFDNFIPNSKKSNSVTSNSADTVATSYAAKTAYNKGVEAKTAADNAQNTANNRVNQYRYLPQGDYNDKTFWQSLEAGRYWYYREINGTNAKSDYAHIDVLRASRTSNELCVLWYSTSGEIYRAHINHQHIRWDYLNPPASTTVAGLTQLNDTVTSTATNQAATTNAVKKANDNANTRVSNKGVELIEGEKTFIYQLKIRSNHDATKFARFGQNGEDTFFQNPYSQMYLQLKNNGELMYQNQPIHHTGRPYVTVKATNAGYAGLNVSRTGTSGNWESRLEALPDRRWKFWSNSGSKGFEQYIPAKNGTMLLDVDAATASTANKLVMRDNSADVSGRLFRATYPNQNTISGAIAFRVNNSGDNYTRYCDSPAAVRGWLGLSVQNVTVLQGVINHGGTLPLPSGYTETQCKFIVSMNSSNPSGTTWDWNESFKGKHYRNVCELKGRVVTCQTIVNEGITGNGAIDTVINGKANYIVIGVK